jgi:hypothetical protein
MCRNTQDADSGLKCHSDMDANCGRGDVYSVCAFKVKDLDLLQPAAVEKVPLGPALEAKGVNPSAPARDKPLTVAGGRFDCRAGQLLVCAQSGIGIKEE